jgi:hypothetical protein
MCRPQAGQALVVMLAFLAILTGAFALVFSTGQVVNDKIRLTNAVDAAAYSAAAWQARSLNYQAYLNRAMVANEVAIAQLVSLRSWSSHVLRTTGNITAVTQWIPALTAPSRVVARAWTAVNRGVQQSAPPLEAGLSHLNNTILAQTQSLAHVGAPLVAADLVSEVLHANEPRAELTPAGRVLQARNGNQWLNRFTETSRRGGGDLHRYTTLLMSSRDGFSASRRGDLLPAASPVQVARRGGTDLIGEYGWRGLDTLSVHVNLLLRTVETPLGWGAAEHGQISPRARGDHGGSLRRNRRASNLAMGGLVRPASNGYVGVPQIRDITNVGRQDDRRLTYTVAARLPVDRMLTVDRLWLQRGLALPNAATTVDVAPVLGADALHALGSAEIYFQRPFDRADGRREFPSLFNPYWQSRLKTVPTADRALTAIDRGIASDPFLVLP